jgi:four helix bundle protein
MTEGRRQKAEGRRRKAEGRKQKAENGKDNCVMFRKFEELPVWRASIDLGVRIFGLSDRGTFKGHPGLRDQIERAVLSISNNVAEGYERGSHAELLTFLYYARGSAGEVRSMLGFMVRADEWSESRPEFDPLVSLCLSISRQLGAWIESVKNSEYIGARNQNEATRESSQAARRQTAFLEKLKRIQDDSLKKYHGDIGEASSEAPDSPL